MRGPRSTLRTGAPTGSSRQGLGVLFQGEPVFLSQSVGPGHGPPLTARRARAPEQLCHVELVSKYALARKDLNSDAADVKQSGRALRHR